MRQTFRRYSNSTHSLPKKVTRTRSMALTILSRSSWRSTGMGGMYTLSFTNPQNEKSIGVRLGDLGGHGMQPSRPIHLSENVWFRYGGQAGNWVISLTWQCGGCYVWDCLSGRTNFNCCRSKAQWSTTSEKLLYFYTDMLNCLKQYNLFLDKIILSDEATFHLSGKVNRHNLIIWGSQNPLQVVEVHRKMDRSWRLHSVATQITQSDTHGLFIFGFRER
jgi:hypothetical protein